MTLRISLVSHSTSLERTVATLKGMLCWAMSVKYFGKEISTFLNCSSCGNVLPIDTGQKKKIIIQSIVVIYCSLEGKTS